MGRTAWKVRARLVTTAARLAWHLEVERQAEFPPPPFVLAANHQSFLDPALVGAAYGARQRFIALADLSGNYRLLDWTLQAFDVIEVRRGSVPLGPIRRALQHLEGGGVVTIFPEGTRVGTFGEVPPRPGGAWLAVKAGVPLMAVAVNGTGEVLGKDNRLRPGRIRMVVGPPLIPLGNGRPAVDELNRRWTEWIASTLALG